MNLENHQVSNRSNTSGTEKKIITLNKSVIDGENIFGQLEKRQSPSSPYFQKNKEEIKMSHIRHHSETGFDSKQLPPMTKVQRNSELKQSSKSGVYNTSSNLLHPRRSVDLTQFESYLGVGKQPA